MWKAERPSSLKPSGFLPYAREAQEQDFIPSNQTQQQVISVITSSSLVEGANQCNQLL